MMRSTPHAVLPVAEAPAPLPSASELAAIAELWKKTRRTFVAQFDGTSMLPTIEPQEAINVRCGAAVAVGDVVLALRDDGLIVHRVVADGGAWIVTRGDARAIPDLPIGRDAVVGVLDAHSFVANARQNSALRFVRLASFFGRMGVWLCIRMMQIAWRTIRANHV